jgi:hypothetical protein
MILDRTLLLSDAQAITVTAVSSNVIDAGAAGTAFGHAAALRRNLAIGAAIPFLVQVVQDFTAGGAATLAIALQTADDEAFSSPVTVYTTPAIALADLKAGQRLFISDYLPKGVNGKGITKRYWRLNYTVATGPMTAGKITAGVVAAVQTDPLDVA